MQVQPVMAQPQQFITVPPAQPGGTPTVFFMQPPTQPGGQPTLIQMPSGFASTIQTAAPVQGPSAAATAMTPAVKPSAADEKQVSPPSKGKVWALGFPKFITLPIYF